MVRKGLMKIEGLSKGVTYRSLNACLSTVGETITKFNTVKTYAMIYEECSVTVVRGTKEKQKH